MSEDQDKTGGPAFPVTAGQNVYATGMSLRDWFAGQALAGMISTSATPWLTKDGHGLCPHTAQAAYQIADAMIAARAEKGDET